MRPIPGTIDQLSSVLRLNEYYTNLNVAAVNSVPSATQVNDDGDGNVNGIYEKNGIM